MRGDEVAVHLRFRAGTLATVVACMLGAVCPQVAHCAEPVAGENSGEPFQSAGVDPFNFVGPSICGMNPATRDAFDNFMLKSGFHKNTGTWWTFTEPSGTTKVSALLPAAKLASIVFVPTRREPLPVAIIEAMTAKAQSVTFVPPDKMSFEFAEIAKLEGCKTSYEVLISLKDGSWLETDQTLKWGVKP